MVITAIPLFAKVNTSAWTYFHESQSAINAITREHLIVALAQSVLKGDDGDVYSAADSKRYAGLKLGDLPCLWVESTEGSFTVPLPSDQEKINKLLAHLTDAAKEATSWEEFKSVAQKRIDRDSPLSKGTGWNPIDILREAIQAVPAMKYALAVLGLVAVVAIVAAWHVDFKVAVFGAVIVLVLMVAVLGFARLARFEDNDFHKPMLVLLWSFVILTIIVAFSLFMAAAFEFPPGLHRLLFSQSETSVTTASPTNPIAKIKAAYVLPDVSIAIGQVDDKIRFTLNGVQIHEGGPTSILIKQTDLKDGDNNLDVDLFNNATRTGGIAALGGAQKEGWGYSFVLSVGKNQFPYSGSHGNDPPDSQWGQWFSVRKIILSVQRDDESIAVREK